MLPRVHCALEISMEEFSENSEPPGTISGIKDKSISLLTDGTVTVGILVLH